MAAAMADWGGLHHDLLTLILKNINLMDDFATFGMVCKSWHTVAAAANKQHLRLRQTPWLMLHAEKAEEERRIFSLSKQGMLTMNLHIPGMSNKKCIGLNYGWVLTTSREEGGMNLVHPFSRAQIRLPYPETIVYLDYHYNVSQFYLFVNKVALSANPSESPDFVLMISANDFLCYWRPGDERYTGLLGTWISDVTHHHGTWISDVTHHQGQFYVITRAGQVWSCMEFGSRHHQRLIFQAMIDTPCKVLYVVAGSTPDSLLVLGSYCDEIYWRPRFQVYELNLITSECSEIKSLGDRAIFIGLNTSVALENASEYPRVKHNHIYFTNNSPIEMGCYNIEDGQTTHFRVDDSLGRGDYPFWFIPTL